MSEKNLPEEIADFQIVQIDIRQLEEVIEVNIGDEGISRFDLDRLKVPTGGTTTWSVPTLEGEKQQEAVEGIVIHWKDVRAYWAGDYTGKNTPPDCYSDDAKIGVGDPGGKCKECPFAEWESAEEGDGQACKQMRILFLLRENNILPLAITAPPTSVGNIKNYFMRLASKGIAFYGAITRFELDKAMSSGGIEYSEIVPSYVQKLTGDALDKMREVREQIKPKLEQVDLEPEGAGEVYEGDAYDITEDDSEED